jgi:NDP-sugar pyrophosphorylase family protein
MLLAAGLGTRLRPLSDLRPKPIVPVANRPLAAFAMDHLARSGATHIVANTHPQAAKVESALAGSRPEGVHLVFSRESELLGTGGGLRRARPLFDDPSAPVVVMNGDTLFAPNLRAAVAQHRAHNAVATMILRRTADPARFGAIGIDSKGRVRSLLGSPAGAPVEELLMFTGVHILAPRAFRAMPESGCVIRTAYRCWVDDGAPVLGIVDDSPWADLGTVAEYHRLNLELASGAFSWPGVTPTEGCILPDGEPRLDGVEQSVIGEGVRVDTGVSLRRCVVWPGAHVTQPATNAVITPEHRIELS